MQRTATAVVSVLAILLGIAPISDARLVQKVAAKCVPGRSYLIAADTRAKIYEAPEPPGPSGDLGVWGCVYGHRPYFLGPLPYASAEGSGGLERETLAGSVVAYEESATGGYYSSRLEQRVVVRDLRTGHVLHRVPTGMPLSPEAKVVGVGNVVAIVAKSDGAVAWIANDYGRALNPATQSETLFFDLEAVDKSGSRLLASGTDIDPLSLALAGSTLYWTQGGVPFSALLK